MDPRPLSASRRARLILGALAAVVTLALAFSAGYFGPRLTAPGDDSAEAGFTRDMAQHHAQAVELSMFAFRLSGNNEIRVMAYDMATMQQAQIGQMQAWLESWRLLPSRTGPAMAWMPDGAESLLPDGRMPGMATLEEINRLKAATGKDVDILFCQLMIRHHLGGVHMAEAILKLSDDSRVVTLAKQIMAGQQTEINNMNRMLQQMGAKPLQ